MMRHQESLPFQLLLHQQCYLTQFPWRRRPYNSSWTRAATSPTSCSRLIHPHTNTTISITIIPHYAQSIIPEPATTTNYYAILPHSTTTNYHAILANPLQPCPTQLFTLFEHHNVLLPPPFPPIAYKNPCFPFQNPNFQQQSDHDPPRQLLPI